MLDAHLNIGWFQSKLLSRWTWEIEIVCLSIFAVLTRHAHSAPFFGLSSSFVSIFPSYANVFQDRSCACFFRLLAPGIYILTKCLNERMSGFSLEPFLWMPVALEIPLFIHSLFMFSWDLEWWAETHSDMEILSNYRWVQYIIKSLCL